MTNQIKSDLLKNPTVKNIDRAKMALDSFFGSLPDRYKELQEPQKIQLERIRTISEHLWVRLNMTEPALIVLNDLTQLRGQADQFAAHIDKSIVEFNPGDLNRAENLADDLLKNMTHIPAAPPGKSGPYTRAANEAALKFEELVKRLRKSEQKNEQLQAIQQSLDEELRGKVVEAAANWDEQYVITYRDLKSKNDDATELLQTVGTGALNRQYITERSTQARHDGLWTSFGLRKSGSHSRHRCINIYFHRSCGNYVG